MPDCPKCSCGRGIIVDRIYCYSSTGSLIHIANADACFKCRRVYAIRMVPGHPEQVTLAMVEGAYRKTMTNYYTWAELKNGPKVPEYNPDKFIEPEEKMF